MVRDPMDQLYSAYKFFGLKKDQIPGKSGISFDKWYDMKRDEALSNPVGIYPERLSSQVGRANFMVWKFSSCERPSFRGPAEESECFSEHSLCTSREGDTGDEECTASVFKAMHLIEDFHSVIPLELWSKGWGGKYLQSLLGWKKMTVPTRNR